MKLTDILTPQRIRVPLQVADKEQAITAMVDVLAADGAIADAAKVLAAVRERERTRTTGIGGGLALPHGKSPAAPQLAMAIGKPAGPIDFDSVDGKPVNLIIMLVSPMDKTGPHIQALAHISRLLSVEAFRRKLIAASSADEMFQLISEQEAQE
jgi:fructose-specific phosphotransferase system IIA component